MVEDRSILSRSFDAANNLFLIGLSLTAFLPFVYVVLHSFSGSVNTLIPTSFTTAGYRFIFGTPVFLRSMMVSLYITVFGTAISLTLTSLMAYGMSYRHLKGRRAIFTMVIITMLFNGGMIPTYFVVRSLGLLNKLWALMLPSAISAFYLIVMKNFFQNIPDELKDSAKIDGAHELVVLFRIVIPLSLPAMAAFGLFYAVGIWNQYFSAVLYIRDSAKWPVQVLLRQIVILATGRLEDSSIEYDPTVGNISQAMKMAVIIVSTLPIIMLYPFLQKHFAKGALVGSVKG